MGEIDRSMQPCHDILFVCCFCDLQQRMNGVVGVRSRGATASCQRDFDGQKQESLEGGSETEHHFSPTSSQIWYVRLCSATC